MPHYWKTLIARAWDDTWSVMGGSSVWTLMIAIAIFLCTFAIIRYWRGHDSMKDFVIETVSGILATIVVGTIVFLVHVFFLTPPAIYADAVKQTAAANPPKQNTALKPLPDKIIPAPALPPILTEQPATNVESPKTFETDLTDTNDAEYVLTQLRGEKQLQIRNLENMASDSWKTHLDIYRYALKSLYDIMKSEATRRTDSITLPTDYLYSLPQTVDHSSSEMNVADIKFTNQTNMYFRIVITGEDCNGVNFLIARGLRISCDCGNLTLNAMWPNMMLNLHLQIPDGDTPWPPQNVDRDLINKKLKLLVAAQLEYLKNKSH